MAIRCKVNRLPLVTDERVGVFRIRAQDQTTLEGHLFQRYPNREWGTFFRFGCRRTAWGVALSYVDALWPGPGDLDRQTDITTFRDQYIRQAFHAAGPGRPAIGVVHSHPAGWRTCPSLLDDDMDSYFGRELNAYSCGAPYCSLIFQRDLAGQFTFTGRVYDRGEWLPVETLFTIGAKIDRFRSEQYVPIVESAAEPLESTTARLESVLGLPSAHRLRAARIGVVGCSGTGSPAVHVLARAGVGGFVLVDPERLGDSNLERLHGSTWRDLRLTERPFKVALMEKLIHSINPAVHVTSLVGNVLHENALDELLNCDVLLGCTDTQHGRVALSDFAQHYLLPALDIGVLMDGRERRVTDQVIDLAQYRPDLPCAFCGERIDGIGMANELMSDEERAVRHEAAEAARRRGDEPDQYWRQQPRQLHTVGYLTTVAGALAAGYVEGWLTGTFLQPHSTFQFDMGRERLGVAVPLREFRAGCRCQEVLGWGDLARSHRNVALPAHWPRRAVLFHRS